MARKYNDGLRRMKADLARAMKAFRRVQEDLIKLRGLGVAEVEIRKVMVALGFAGVRPEEFIGAKKPREVVRVIKKLRESGLN